MSPPHTIHDSPFLAVEVLLDRPVQRRLVGDKLVPQRRLDRHEDGADVPLPKEGLREEEVRGSAAHGLPCTVRGGRELARLGLVSTWLRL